MVRAEGLELVTARLTLRRLRPTDAPALFAVVGNPVVMRHWAPGPDPSVTDTARRIADIEAHWQAHGFGDWAAIERISGRLIGFGGLHHLAGMAEVNVGYALAPDHWGRGLAGELCRAALAVAFTRLALAEVVAVIAPVNAASIRVAERCGLRFWQHLTWAGRERVAYRITREDYLPGDQGEPGNAHRPPW